MKFNLGGYDAEELTKGWIDMPLLDLVEDGSIVKFADNPHKYLYQDGKVRELNTLEVCLIRVGFWVDRIKRFLSDAI